MQDITNPNHNKSQAEKKGENLHYWVKTQGILQSNSRKQRQREQSKNAAREKRLSAKECQLDPQKQQGRQKKVEYLQTAGRKQLSSQNC